MAPAICEPAGALVDEEPACTVTPGSVVLSNSYYRFELVTGQELGIEAFVNRYTGNNILPKKDEPQAFVLEVNGRPYSLRDFSLVTVRELPDACGVTLECAHAEHQIGAELSFHVDGSPELRVDLCLRNGGREDVLVKAAFPYIGGIQISDDSTDDYYLFPYSGGIIADRGTELDASYGRLQSWYQLIDVFSPRKGGGLYTHVLDTEGRFKVFALRKGLGSESPGDVPDKVQEDYGAIDPELRFENPVFPDTDDGGIRLAVKYLGVDLSAGEELELPPVALGVHSGDWHSAMEKYAEWAHKVWEWHPLSERLKQASNIAAGGWFSRLFEGERFRREFWLAPPRLDLLEFYGYWNPDRERGAWDIPLDRLEEELGTSFVERFSHYVPVDPRTNERVWLMNIGDHTDYNQAWGGGPALRAGIESVQEAGVPVTLYVEGVRLYENTRTGKEYGRRYGMVNPRYKDYHRSPIHASERLREYITAYAAYNMCVDNEVWPEFLAEQTRQLYLDLGIDGVRFDEWGTSCSANNPCLSEEHDHTCATHAGHNAALRAQGIALQKIRETMEPHDAGFILMTEAIGHDFMAQSIDGCLSKDSSRFGNELRPVPCNIFRFYFPELKFFEMPHTDQGYRPEYAFWNGVAVFLNPFLYRTEKFSAEEIAEKREEVEPERFYRIIDENLDAFTGDSCEPLMPTRAQYVYANRFASDGLGKEIITLFNDTGEDYDGCVLSVEPLEGRHCFDLLAGMGLEPVSENDGWCLHLRIAKDSVGCVAILPRYLDVESSDDRIRIAIAEQVADPSLVVSSPEGHHLMAVAPDSSEITFDVTQMSERPAVVKYLSGGRLVDAAAVPERNATG
jgi:hypothetical protein